MIVGILLVKEDFFEKSQVFQFRYPEGNNVTGTTTDDYWLVLATITMPNEIGAKKLKKQLLFFYKNPLTGVSEVSQVPTMPGLRIVDSVSTTNKEGLEVKARDNSNLLQNFT
ncbi:hypothetical protein AUJ77_00415 [Candidatus Nomurabacteria bacterium CG1_02_43_90]|uniref:Uncharacterized protein n=1 Tax=Candidatus Nomurabacteria bacterium CG1_02_43_90 TaxID=1805281 RepID=A0A1J4V286_9BACT|nr:MAG: hypothetical protein AUJ77_00415 [Candidatus Nomurabacteria bacterium CG1_02_43_90]